MEMMKAAVFRGTGIVRIDERAKPIPRTDQAVIRITTTAICGTDVHIVKGEYPVKPGVILGHEPVGVIDSLGEGLEDEHSVGQRVIVGAITPCGQCFYCLNSAHSQCHGPLGGWRFGNTIDGAWAEYLLVPDARGRAERYRASGSTPARSLRRTTRSTRDSAIRRSSRRSAREERSACDA
jgi:alcohol dehydrogenase